MKEHISPGVIKCINGWTYLLRELAEETVSSVASLSLHGGGDSLCCYELQILFSVLSGAQGHGGRVAKSK